MRVVLNELPTGSATEKREKEVCEFTRSSLAERSSILLFELAVTDEKSVSHCPCQLRSTHNHSDKSAKFIFVLNFVFAFVSHWCVHALCLLTTGSLAGLC